MTQHLQENSTGLPAKIFYQMENENGNLSPLGEDESIIEEADSMYSLPQEAGEVLNVWILAKRLKKYRQMKKLEEVN